MRKSRNLSNSSNRSNLMTWTGLPLKHLLLPNIDLFRVIKGKNDEILEAIGIQKAYRRWFVSTKGDNNRYNRYLYRILGRLHKYAIEKEETKFVNLLNLVMKKSAVFKLLLLWKTDRSWYKVYSVKRIQNIIRRFNLIVRNDISKFKFKRIWIPKANGKMRPLSVPPYEWRMVTKGYNIFLTIWALGTEIKMAPSQFGVLKGAGTGKAWEHILSKIKSKYIYEFDLAKFFDTIPWNTVTGGLYYLGYPEALVEKCEKLMRNSMSVMTENSLRERISLWDEIQKESLTDTFWSFLTWSKKDKNRFEARNNYIFAWKEQSERILKVYELTMEGKEIIDYMEPFYEGEKVFWKMWSDVFKSNKSKTKKWDLIYKILVYLVYKENEGQSRSRLNRERQIFQMKLWLATFGLFRGIPQGMGLSPLLAASSMAGIYENWPNLIMYIDDGLIMSDDPIDIEKFEDELNTNGLYLAHSKSGWVKKDGIWLKNLKFLGLEYIPENDSIKGKTRKGNEFTMPSLEAIRNSQEIQFKSESLNRGMNKMIKDELNDIEIYKKFGLWSWVVSYMYGTSPHSKEKKVNRKSIYAILNMDDKKVNFTSKLVGTCLDVVSNKKIEADDL